MTDTIIPHIHHDQQGVAWIDDTGIQVADVAFARLVQNLGPEQTQQQYPLLSLAQIHAALAYYYDHRHTLAPVIQGRLQRPPANAGIAHTGQSGKRGGRRFADLVGSVPYHGPRIPDGLLQAPVDLQEDSGDHCENGP